MVMMIFVSCVLGKSPSSVQPTVHSGATKSKRSEEQREATPRKTPIPRPCSPADAAS